MGHFWGRRERGTCGTVQLKQLVFRRRGDVAKKRNGSQSTGWAFRGMEERVGSVSYPEKKKKKKEGMVKASIKAALVWGLMLGG